MDDEGEMQDDNVVDPYDHNATGEDGTGDDEHFMESPTTADEF